MTLEYFLNTIVCSYSYLLGFLFFYIRNSQEAKIPCNKYITKYLLVLLCHRTQGSGKDLKRDWNAIPSHIQISVAPLLQHAW